MPPHGGKRTPLTPSYTWGQRGLEAQFRTVFQPDLGIFSPGYPLAPLDPEELRVWDFPVGVNTIYTPRAYEAVSFDELRALADGHDITRLVIETRKDQIEKLDWTIKPVAGARIGSGTAARVARVAAFWRRPDGERPFATWLREVLEDVLVLDAPALEMRRNRAGELIGLDPVDGATIKVLIDDEGRAPEPPDPAYQQILHGVPKADFSRDELLYLPRNPRTAKVYGFSPVEQIVTTVNIALRRQQVQLQYFTEGNMPEALVGVPQGWTMEQIREFQEYWDTIMAGNIAERRHARFVPADFRYQATRDAPLKDDFDEWLARVVCYAFGVPATPFVRQVNRATAETAEDVADREGLAPLMGWAKALVDRLLADLWGRDDLEFVWLPAAVIDPTVQARIDALYIQAGVMTADEIRGRLGLPPHPNPPQSPPPDSTPPHSTSEVAP